MLKKLIKPEVCTKRCNYPHSSVHETVDAFLSFRKVPPVPVTQSKKRIEMFMIAAQIATMSLMEVKHGTKKCQKHANITKKRMRFKDEKKHGLQDD